MSELSLHRGISFPRIGAMILRYWYLLLSSWPRLLELMYWPILQVITWGFLQSYIAQNAGYFARAGGTLIGAVILWDILFRGQLGFSISFLEEMWSRNLGNLMMSPLKPIEFLLALMAMSIIRLALGVIPDDAAGALYLRLQFLRAWPAGDRVLLQSDLHELGGRDFRLGPRVAQRPRRGEHCLDADVRVVAARLRLLSGQRCCRSGCSMSPGACRRPMYSRACGRF